MKTSAIIFAATIATASAAMCTTTDLAAALTPFLNSPDMAKCAAASGIDVTGLAGGTSALTQAQIDAFAKSTDCQNLYKAFQTGVKSVQDCQLDATTNLHSLATVPFDQMIKILTTAGANAGKTATSGNSTIAIGNSTMSGNSTGSSGTSITKPGANSTSTTPKPTSAGVTTAISTGITALAVVAAVAMN